jgi:hypothetical protein
MNKKTLYRIQFTNTQDSNYEIYARFVTESELFGFIEVEELVFGEQTSLVVDPSEERLKLEFANVKRTFIPMHTIIRIDEVTKQGIPKIKDNTNFTKITPFPGPKQKG